VNIPPAPWHLTGEAIGFIASPLSFRLLVNYHSSPVGPYLEHALVKLKYEKGVLAPHVFQMSVNLEASKIGGRTIWGFPKTLEELSWREESNRIEVIREGEQFNIRGFGPKLPVRLSFVTLQELNGEWLKVPGQISAKCQGAFRGKQFALIISEFSLVIDPPIHA